MPDVPRLGSGIPLVARGREMARLRAALDRAAGGSAGAVVIAGDAGVGKTRMVEEVSRIATTGGAIVLSGRCVDVGEAGLPYLPFAEALGQLSGHEEDPLLAKPALSMLLPGRAPVTREAEVTEPQRFVPSFGKVPGTEPRREQDLGQLQLFDAVHAVLSDLAKDSLVMLVIEDLHWADSSTRGLLLFLLSRLRSQRLLILCTYRSDDLHRRHPLRPLLAELVRLSGVERLDLPPFDKNDAKAFVAALSDANVDDETVRRVAEQSEGNAFFAEELLAAFSDSDTGIPASLVDVLLSRVERLSEPAQQIIRLASVPGRSVQHQTLRDVSDLDDIALEEALREAVQHHVLVTSGDQARYAFRHALLREAVYSDLLPGERVRMHAAYAKYLRAHQDGRNAAALAYHSLESNALPAALSASVQAEREATELGAPGEALRHLEQALRLWDSVAPDARPEGVDELKLLLRASWAAGKSGDPERAIAYARSAVKAADKQSDAVLRAEARRRLAQTLMTVDGGEDEARTVIESAWKEVADLPPSHTRAWVLAVQARMLRADHQYQLAEERARMAVTDGQAVDAAGAQADALATLAITSEAMGDVTTARDLLMEARDLAARADAITVELRARFYLGLLQYEEGVLDAAVEAFDDGVERAKCCGLSWSDFGLELRVLKVIVHYANGDWDASEEAAEQPRGRVSNIVSGRLAATGLHVMVGRGQFADAERLIANLRPHWPLELQIALNCGVAGAEMATWRGRPELAVDRVKEAVHWSKKVGGAWLMSGIKFGALGAAACADIAHKATVKRDEAAAAAAVAEGERFVEHARKTANLGIPRNGVLGPEGRAWLARAEAELTRLYGQSDPDAWAAVVQAFDFGPVYEQAQARWRYAEALLGADRRDDAQCQLRTAHEVAEHLGAKPFADAVGQLARRGRLSLSEDGTIPRDTLDLFTPREQSVLRLVALGQTNRQVGEELYISEKTVSVHLSRIMAKLGASRRAEAVAIAYDRGLLD